jgi:hypothetical protein
MLRQSTGKLILVCNKTPGPPVTLSRTSLAEDVLGRKRPWPKTAMAENVLGRRRPWPKTALAEDGLGRRCPGRRRPGRRRPWPKTSLAEDVLGRRRPWPKPSLAEAVLVEDGLGRSRPLALVCFPTHWVNCSPIVGNVLKYHVFKQWLIPLVRSVWLIDAFKTDSITA